MSRWGKWAALTAALVGSAFLGTRLGVLSELIAQDGSGAAAGPAQAAAPGRVAVTSLGRLEPRDRVVDVGAPEPGRIERLLVEEGEAVERGHELFVLESHDERLAERDLLAARLLEADRRLVAETVLGEKQILEAEILQQRMAELRPLKIQAQEARVRARAAEQKRSEMELARLAELAETSVVSERDYEDQELLVEGDRERLNEAQATLAELQLEQEYTARLRAVQVDRYRAELARSQVLIEIESLKRQLALAEVRLRRATVRAPADGRILRVMVRPGERADEQPVLQMGDTREMHAVAEVYETDISLVRVGQRAAVESPAFAEPLTGVVQRVGSLVFKNDVLDVDPAADVDARIVEVRVRLDESEPVAGLTNLQVKVRIEL